MKLYLLPQFNAHEIVYIATGEKQWIWAVTHFCCWHFGLFSRQIKIDLDPHLPKESVYVVEGSSPWTRTWISAETFLICKNHSNAPVALIILSFQISRQPGCPKPNVYNFPPFQLSAEPVYFYPITLNIHRTQFVLPVEYKPSAIWKIKLWGLSICIYCIPNYSS